MIRKVVKLSPPITYQFLFGAPPRETKSWEGLYWEDVKTKALNALKIQTDKIFG